MRLLAAALAVLASSGVAPPAQGARAAARTGATVATHSSAYGTILTDGRGRALYVFTRDRQGPSRCAGACAAAWPPLLTRGAPRAVRGADARLLGTTRRKDGRRQVTYRGRPVYFYVGDRLPGQVLCQDVFEYGGRWLVVRPSGRVVR